MKRISSLLALILAISALPIFAAHAFEGDDFDFDPNGKAKCVPSEWKDVKEAPATVVRGVDGDTVVVAVKQKQYSIRMLTIDTPETHFNGKSQGYWGEVAADRLKELLPANAAVRIVFDGEHCDRYGRLLATVFKGQTNINLKMIEDGYAFNYCIAPNLAFCEANAAAAREAIKAGRNAYGDSGLQVPYEWRREMSGRPHEKWVGNIQTKLVYPPDALDKVPLADRVFFMKESAIKLPYKKAGLRAPIQRPGGSSNGGSTPNRSAPRAPRSGARF